MKKTTEELDALKSKWANDPITLCTWQESFLAHLQNKRLSAKSVTLAIQHVRVFSAWHEDTFHQAFDPGLLTNYDLHLYRKVSLEQDLVKAATWNSRHWALGILCQWIGIPDLMDGVEQKSSQRASTKHRSLTQDEYHRLVHIVEQDTMRTVTTFEHGNALRNRAAVHLMLAGLRVEEASLTTAADVVIGERSGSVLVRNGKGSKERTVQLNLIVRRALASYLDLKPVSVTLFDLSTRTLQRIVADLGERIGVPDLTPHWLRYTFAKRLEQAGVSIESIRDLLGHNSIETTRRYLRSSSEELQSAVERIV